MLWDEAKIMVLTKKWLQELIDNTKDPETKLALETVFLKYTEAPVKGKSETQSKLKDFDADELFAKIMHNYVDKKGYSVEEAEVVAKRVINQQKEMRGQPLV